jgi:drug/metabolite transporter (DMT)-like permease
MTQEQQALVAAGLTAALWGLTGIVVRLLPSVAPEAVALGRLLVSLAATLPLLGLSASLRRDVAHAITRPVAWWLALLLGAYYLSATAAFQMAPVAEVALLLSTSPLFVLTLRYFARPRPARQELAGAIVALLGMGVVMAPRLDMSGDSSHLAGNGLALLAATFTAVYAWLYRRLADQAAAPGSLGVAFLTFLVGSIVLAIPLSALDELASLVTGPAQFGLLLALGLLCTALPSLGFAFASRRLPAVVSASILLLVPLFAALFAYLLLDEILSSSLPLGGVLVLGGMAWILGGKK